MSNVIFSSKTKVEVGVKHTLTFEHESGDLDEDVEITFNDLGLTVPIDTNENKVTFDFIPTTDEIDIFNITLLDVYGDTFTLTMRNLVLSVTK